MTQRLRSLTTDGGDQRQGPPSFESLSIMGGRPIFEHPRSTAGLYRPDFENFMQYSSTFIAQRQYTNNGPMVRLLELRLAELHRVDHCIAVVNGFWSLVLAMRVLAAPGKKEVIMPSLTYRRMADAVVTAGLVPHFVDVDPATLAMGVNEAKPAIGASTALILGVHPMVNVCDAPGLTRLAHSCSIPILFDSVESTVEMIEGQKVGSFEDAECFSLHASKLINGFEGGYITTNNADLADELRLLRGFGFQGQDTIVSLGLNAKLNEVHASMALANLDALPLHLRHNEDIYDAYSTELASIPGLELMSYSHGEATSFKTILVRLNREWGLTQAESLKVLNAEGIFARPYYNPPLHWEQGTRGAVSSATTTTDALARSFLVLPSGHQVSTADVGLITELLRFIGEHSQGIKKELSTHDT